MKPTAPFQPPPATDPSKLPEGSLRIIVARGAVVDRKRMAEIRREVLEHRAMLDRWREVEPGRKWRRT